MLQFNHHTFKYSLLTVLMLGFLQVQAQQLATEQQNRAYLQQVEESYNVGHFSEVVAQLKRDLNTLSGVSRVSAYRLLALSSLQLDETKDAEYYTKLMLDTDPYYTTTLQDPPRFVDLINQFKNSGARITTASYQAETLEESPVPVTLITEDMIKASGVRTLNELLALYVPGMTEVEGVESNIALRGLYASRQETMLIMLNGHRLNSETSNSESLDYRTNLDKIKQIEILRGPASSLYGNVALTAAINIITKNGSDYDGVTLTGTAGLNKSFGANLVGGKSGVNYDFLVWGSVYTSSGEQYDSYEINGYNNSPAYDLGIKAHWNDFSAQITAQSSKCVPLINQIQLTDSYDYDSYQRIDGVKPGLTYSSFHGTIGYQHSWKNVSLNVEAFGTRESSVLYNVLGDSIQSDVAELLLNFLGLDNLGLTPMTRGVAQILNWTSYNLGVNSRLAWQYKLGEKSYGTLLAGINYEHYEQLVGDIKLFDYYGSRARGYFTVFAFQGRDGESTSSAFLQLKHNFSKHVILNSGLRFDYKTRYDETYRSHLSPRLSMIWIPSESLAFKAGWAHSFVDAPYIYRACMFPFYHGTNLESETLNSTQIGFSYQNKPKHVRYELNLFHNQANNLVHSDITKIRQDMFLSNSGKIKTIGMEHVLEYTTAKILANVNLTCQKVVSQYGLSLDNQKDDETRIANIPALSMNATLSRQVFNKPWGKVWFRTNVHAQTATYSEYLTLENVLIALNGKHYEISYANQPFYAKVNAGVDYEYKKVRLSLSAYNLFNTRTYVGGSIQAMTPQEGFNFLSKVSFSF